MKKNNLLVIGGVLSSMFIIQSCQQPAADQSAIDAKVTEAYQAEKMKVENEAAAACEEAINAQVKAIQDSMATLNAKQQADLLSKKQRELKAAQAKVVATMKKKVIGKTTTEIEKERKANSMGSGNNAAVQVTKEQTLQKANSMGSGENAPIKVTEEQTKSKASKMGSGN